MQMKMKPRMLMGDHKSLDVADDVSSEAQELCPHIFQQRFSFCTPDITFLDTEKSSMS